jgi:hypothetical protein
MPGPYTSFETTGAYSTLVSGTEIRAASGYSAVNYKTIAGGGGGGGSGAPFIGEILLPDGVVGQAYIVEESAAPPGASTPITFSIISGALPPGLTLTSPSTSVWEISGTPTTPGTYTFTLKAVNSIGNVTASLSINIDIAVGANTGFVG